MDRLQPRIRGRVLDRLDLIVVNPTNATTSKPLHGPRSAQWSSRVEDLRILYEIDTDVRVIDIIDIGPRGDIYKR